jgi:hypothetical protein
MVYKYQRSAHTEPIHEPYNERAARKRHTTKLKRVMVDLAGGHCQRCGYQEFLSALEFHHVDPETKQATPAFAIRSGNFEIAYEELDKCVLLCRNCHMALEAFDWEPIFVKRDGLGWTIFQA